MRRSQIRMGESITIVFVFFLLVIFGLIFYSKMEARNIRADKSENEELGSIEVAQKAIFLPEIRCSREGVVTYNCFDTLKLEAMEALNNDTQEKKFYYYNLFGYATINVIQLYPDTGTEWEIYSNEGTNWTRRMRFQIPVALFNATGDAGYSPPMPSHYSFGVLIVDSYV